MKKTLLLLLLLSPFCYGQQIGLLKYNGGGDWYSNPTALPNLIAFCNANINTNIDAKPITVEPSSNLIFDLPFVHMTGHGNVVFSPADIQNLRNYLIGGGFLHIDDNYGMDEFIRKEIKKIFPENNLIELPKSHPIFNSKFPFPDGLPKIHEHNNSRPQAYGIIIDNRLVLLYTYESDLGDGWENPEIHNDPETVRQKALKMGANIIHYIFTN